MERRTLRFADFDAALREAESLRAAGYDRAGSWGLAQVCNHLATVVEMSLDGFPSRLPWPVRQLARWLVLPRILRREVFRRRVAAPAYLLPPDAADDEAALARLRSALGRFTTDPGTLRPSPIFGSLSLAQWREVHLWHAEHHFSFLLPRHSA
jgi:Protein of unknown function (DUF1569)